MNASLNYGYGLLEGECLKAINEIGLEPTVGFLHTLRHREHLTKNSLVYDLEEPFRWLVDLTVMEMFTSNQLDLKDFFFTGDDYNYRFEHDAKLRFIQALSKHFKTKVPYNGRTYSWSNIIEEKTRQLGRFMIDGSELDFVKPTPILRREIVAT